MTSEKIKYYARLALTVLAALALVWNVWQGVTGHNYSMNSTLMILSASNAVGTNGKFRIMFIVFAVIFAVMMLVHL
jgi:hypothetical protein